MDEKEYLKQYAYEMFRQLGGKEFIAMTGAHSMTYMSGEQIHDDKCIVAMVFLLPKCTFNKHKIKRVGMHLMGDDTYTFKFYTADKTVFKTVSDVYCDEVKDVFELNTGLLVSVYNREGSQVVVGVNV